MMDMLEINNLINTIKAQLNPMCRKSFYPTGVANKQLLFSLNELANSILVYQENTIRCRYKYLQLWRKYTISLEGDLLIATFLAARSISLNEDIEQFDWKIVIDHDNETLNSIFKQGMVDNHYHLGGALLIFQCTWVNLMENEQCRNRIISSLDEMHILTRAALIRKLLENFLNTKGIAVSWKKCQESIEDYYEERKFLYYIIRELMKENENEDIGRLFYDYLVIKEWIRAHIVQGGNSIGEQAFWMINRNKNMVLECSKGSEKIVRSSVCEQIRSNYIKALEVRIKMKESSNALCEYIAWLEQQIGSLGVSVRYIICLSRSNRFETDQACRDQSKRMEVFKQQKEIKTFLEANCALAKKVVGVDICSKESNYKPEVFSEVMCRKKKGLDARLKRMYHTGEGYTDLLSGLRAVDECISFFELGSGDRLGHATPIFEDVTEWYNSRKNRVIISKEDYIDNIAWLYCNAPSKIQRGETGEKILRDFKKQFLDLYGDAFSQKLTSTLNPSIELCLDIDKVSIFHYFESWYLRSQRPEEIKTALENNSCRGSVLSYYIAYCYFYNSDVRKIGRQIIDIYISKDQVKVISSMQRWVIKKIMTKRICIEVCPSSSILLGTVKNGYCHPIINWFKHFKREYHKTDIQISINTDDQGIFSTSLLSEYSLLVSAFEKEISSKEEKENLYKWIDDLRKNSIAMCK